MATATWDVFCRVVDNFGDVAVSWRLARQLAREHGKRTRLFLDDLGTLARLRPEIDLARHVQQLDGVELRTLHGPPEESVAVADAVIETFGCDPPDDYVQAMAAREAKPRWINLEYLSAEDWVEGSHALPSPHPRLPLTKHFFFPGFTPRTGGLLREAGLMARRDLLQKDRAAQADLWRHLAGRVPPEGTLKVSLFSYAGAPLEALADTLAARPAPTWLVVPEGFASIALGARQRAHGSLETVLVPFLPQDQYDLLLWASDLNFVRGEDSFVRAQWAGRPFVWNIYPTEDGAHFIKMGAFLARYTAGLDAAGARAVTALWEAWNRPEAAAEFARAWGAVDALQPALRPHAAGWAAGLAARPDLASQLVDFVDNVL